MVKIQSSVLGSQSSDPEREIVFPDGLPGFESCKTYQLFHESGDHLVGYLQAVDDPDVTFSVLVPEHLNIYYEFILDDEELSLLKLDSPDDVLLLLIAYRGQLEDSQETGDGPRVNASFMAPLVINFRKRLGLQKVLQHAERRITIKAG